MSKEEIENKIATFTGGRAAEEVAFGSVTTGASNDIEQATKLARAMITRYGMSDDFDMVALETVTNQYLGGDASLACSAETQTRIDQQVVALVKREHQKALDILRENRTKLDELANFLYEKETITGEEFMGMTILAHLLPIWNQIFAIYRRFQRIGSLREMFPIRWQPISPIPKIGAIILFLST